MTDLLAKQSEIKSRRTPIRDKSGQFIRPSAAVEARVIAERMKARLRAELDAADHALGRVRVQPHFRPLPNAKLQVVESDIPHIGRIAGPDLFERAAA